MTPALAAERRLFDLVTELLEAPDDGLKPSQIRDIVDDAIRGWQFRRKHS